MTPILGTIASSTRQGLSSSSYESIATVFGTGSSTSVNLTSIPTGYSALQIRYSARTTGSGGADQAVAVGSVTGGTEDFIDFYHYSVLTATTYNSGSGTDYLFNTTTGAAPANRFAAGFIDIPNYDNANFKKVISSWGYVPLSAGYMFNASGLWNSTTAITNLRFTSTNGNWTSDSYFALYGLKG
jgi:hypothetical protein